MGTAKELDAAGITDPELRHAYAYARALNGGKTSTFFAGTWLLPPAQRPHVCALYNFGKWVDDIVDNTADTKTPDSTASRLTALDDIEHELRDALAGKTARRPIIRAVAETARRHGIESHYFMSFLATMRSDLRETHFASYSDLRAYTYGSAEVFGLAIMPVLGTVVPREEAAPYAANYAMAFQLTNILRDVAEDLDRGRVYLPSDVLDSYNVDHDLLRHCRRTKTQDGRVRRALSEIAHKARDMYQRAEPGCSMIHPVARACVYGGFQLYQAILDEITGADFDVWTQRHRASTARRIRVALPALARTAIARLGA